jgi:hypothetical protein
LRTRVGPSCASYIARKGRLVARRLWAAFEIVDREADLAKPGLHRIDVTRLAAMRGTGERDLAVGELVAIGGAGFDQQQSEQRLDRRAAVDRRLEIAPGGDDPAMGIDHRAMHLVPALDQVAAPDIDLDRAAVARHRGQVAELRRRMNRMVMVMMMFVLHGAS